MRMHSLWAVTLGLARAAAPPALAAGKETGPTAPPPMPEIPGDRAPTPEERQALARHEAAELYEEGQKELQKAEKEQAEAEALLAAGDSKSAEKASKKLESARKRFDKARQRFRDATIAWPEYADAWNLLGYSLRRQGRLEEAFDAYWRCLEIDPEHAGAHEYLGEAWLLAGRLDQAESELAWLERREAEEADALRAAIASYKLTHPQTTAGDSTAAVPAVPARAVAADSTGAAR